MSIDSQTPPTHSPCLSSFISLRTADTHSASRTCWLLSSVFQLGIFYEGPAPCRTVLRLPDVSSALPKLFIRNKNPCSKFLYFYLQNAIAVFVFSDIRCKNACKCLQICAHVFINRPQNCAQTSFRSRAGLRPNFGRSRVKVCLT